MVTTGKNSVEEEGSMPLGPPSAIVAAAWTVVSVSDVINSRLALVIIPRRVSALEVVVHPACTMTTTSML